MIIGLAGRIHSGKDSAGAALIETYDFKRVAFADGVREFVAAMFGWPIEWVNNSDFKNGVMLADVMNPIGQAAKRYTGRELLQRVGTEAARKVFGDDCWIKVAMAKCADALELTGKCAHCGYNADTHAWPSGKCPNASPYDYTSHFISPKHYVITDVRFPNEVAAIKAAGGKVIRLNRADRLHSHGFVPCAATPECSLGPVCHYDMNPNVINFCKLPREAHPSHYSGQTHPSETSLPDESNETIKYDATITGSMERNVAGVLDAVAGWLR